MNFQRKPARLLITLGLLGLTGLASAANLSQPAYALAKDQLKSSYKAERDSCDSLSGNAKDVCVERAKGKEKVSLAHLEYQYTGRDGDRNDYYKSRVEARYEIAKEMCDSLAGNAKDVCVAEAKATRDKAKADMKADQKIVAAYEDAVEKKLKADYKVAAERCDALSGDAKDSCVASAKAHYYQ